MINTTKLDQLLTLLRHRQIDQPTLLQTFLTIRTVVTIQTLLEFQDQLETVDIDQIKAQVQAATEESEFTLIRDDILTIKDTDGHSFLDRLQQNLDDYVDRITTQLNSES